MNLIDCHTHTNNSPDGYDTASDMCKKAIENGLSVYGISDHCEANCYYPKEFYNIVGNENDYYNFEKKSEKSISEVTELKETYKGKLKLLCGIELGQAHQDFQVAEKVVSDKRLDFIIGSVHNLTGFADFAFLYYPHENKEHLLEAYYKEMLTLCRWGKFDILGHLTYPLRYMVGEQEYNIDMEPFNDIIDEIFRTVISNGKGIEINTSGLRQKYGKTFPDLSYVKRYRELGGEIISVGSDAHKTCDLAKGIKEGELLAKEAGFRYITYFESRKPQFLSID